MISILAKNDTFEYPQIDTYLPLKLFRFLYNLPLDSFGYEISGIHSERARRRNTGILAAASTAAATMMDTKQRS